MKINIKSKSVFKKWLGSYLIIILLFIATMAASVTVSNKLISNKLNELKEHIILSSKNSIDREFSNIENTMLQIASENDVETYLKMNNSDEREATFQASLARDKLKNFIMGNPLISTVYIYSAKHDKIISNGGTSPLNTFYDNYHKNSITFEKWKTILNGKYQNDYIYFAEEENGKKCVKYIANATTLPLGNSSECFGNMFILIDMNKFAMQTANNKIDNDTVLKLIDDEGNVLSFDNGKCYIGEDSADGKDDIAYISQDAGRNFKYILSESGMGIRKIMILQMLIILVFMIISVAVCAFVAYRYAMKNYLPLKNVMNHFDNLECNGNEFEILDKSVKELLDERSKLENKLDKQKKGAYANMLAKLLKSRITDYDNITENLRLYDIKFDYPHFCVIGFYINNFENILNELISTYKEDMHSISVFILNNVFEELISEYFPVYFTETDNILVGIVNMPNADEKNIETLRNIYGKADKILAEEFNLSFFMSVSEIKDTITAIPELYNQVQENFENIFTSKGKKFFVYNTETNKISGSDSNYNLREQKIYSLIRTLNFEAALAETEAVAEEYLSDSNNTYISKIRFYSLTCAILDALSCILEEKTFNAVKTDIDILNKYVTTEQYTSNLKKVFARIESMIKEETNNADNCVKAVKDIVENEYGNKDLSLALISERLNMSVSALAKEFKKLSGDTVLNYIHKVRIKKAKLLLMNTAMMIKDIAELTGYDYVITFIRIFKKYEGITPTEYREAYKK